MTETNLCIIVNVIVEDGNYLRQRNYQIEEANSSTDTIGDLNVWLSQTKRIHPCICIDTAYGKPLA